MIERGKCLAVSSRGERTDWSYIREVWFPSLFVSELQYNFAKFRSLYICNSSFPPFFHVPFDIVGHYLFVNCIEPSHLGVVMTEIVVWQPFFVVVPFVQSHIIDGLIDSLYPLYSVLRVTQNSFIDVWSVGCRLISCPDQARGSQLYVLQILTVLQYLYYPPHYSVEGLVKQIIASRLYVQQPIYGYSTALNSIASGVLSIFLMFV